MMRYRYGPATINMMILPSHPMIQAGPEGTTPLFPKPATLQEHYNPLRDRGCTSARGGCGSNRRVQNHMRHVESKNSGALFMDMAV